LPAPTSARVKKRPTGFGNRKGTDQISGATSRERHETKASFYSHFKILSKQSYIPIKESKNLSSGRSKGAALLSSSCGSIITHLYTKKYRKEMRAQLPDMLQGEGEEKKKEVEVSNQTFFRTMEIG